MGLPFVDDFAWPSLADEEGTVTIKRWESGPVRRTFTLALDPPTLGVPPWMGWMVWAIYMLMRPIRDTRTRSRRAICSWRAR